MKAAAVATVALLLAGALKCAAEPPQAGSDSERAIEFTRSMDAKNAAGTNRETLPGAKVYRQLCAQCHEGQAPKAPAKTFVEMMTPEAIYAALTDGAMRRIAAGLSEADRKAVAEYLAGETFGGPAPPEAPLCTGAAARFDTAKPPRIVGWGFDAGNTNFIPAETAGLRAEDVPRLKLKWAYAFPGALRARSRPALAMGALFVGSQGGAVYALDAATGCIRWTFRTNAEVRTAIVLPGWTAGDPSVSPTAYFGDLIGRVYAVDARTGALRWRVKVDEHPSATITGSPVYHDGRLYVPVSSLEEASADPHYPCCTFRGSVLALDAATGKRLWKSYTIESRPRKVGKTRAGTNIFAPSGAAIWNTPAIDLKRGVLYVGTGNNYTEPAGGHADSIIAFDLKTGALRWAWRAVPDDTWNVGCMIGNDNCPSSPGPDWDLGSGAMLATGADGRERMFVGMKNGIALALDPDTHRKIWDDKVGRGSSQGGIQFGMTTDGTRLYVPIADMADTKNRVERDANVAPRPGLYALDPATGKLLWASPAANLCAGRPYCDPGILASITSIPGVVFAGHMDGRVQAYAAASGAVLWSIDTSVPLQTLSGIEAHGGTVGGGGPVIQDGVVYVSSGYGLYFHMPGNVLLAFSVDGK